MKEDDDIDEDKKLTLANIANEVKKVTVKSGQRTYELNLDLVKQLAASGMEAKQIAAFFGMSIAELRKKRKVSDMLDQAIEVGKARGEARVASKLLSNAIKDNNIIAQIFYLKAKCGWKESDKAQSDDDNKDRVKVYLPDNGRD